MPGFSACVRASISRSRTSRIRVPLLYGRARKGKLVEPRSCGLSFYCTRLMEERIRLVPLREVL